MRFFSTMVASVLGSLIAIGLLVFIGFLIATAFIASSFSTFSSVQAPVASESILTLRLSGPIEEYGISDPTYELFDLPQPTSLAQISSALDKAAGDDRIKAVWLKPQGVIAGWPTLAEIRQSLLEFKESGKPVIASASGDVSMRESDYFLATAADSIYAAPGAFFEFNGLSLSVLFYKGLLEKLNIEPTILRVGTYKGAIEPYTREDLSRENREQLAAILENWNQLLTNTTAEARGMSEEHVQNLIQTGTILTTEDAVEADLLDGLLSEENVRTRLKKWVEIDGRLRTTSLSTYSSSGSSGSSSYSEAIGVLTASGTIMSGNSSDRNGLLGATTVERSLRSFRENDDVKAVVLRIDSPGGSATASEAMWQAVKETSNDKPVVVSMGDMAASGGYWLATAGDTILASPHTLTGSIGVFGMHLSLGRMMETKLGITYDHVSTSDFADMFSGMRPLRDAERALFERSLGQIYTKFLERVSESRGMTVDAVDAIGQGRIWTGEAALNAGLVDQLGDLDDAIEIAAEMAGLEKDEYRIRRLPRPRTLMDRYLDLFMIGIRSVFESPIEAQLRTEARLLEEAVRLHATPIARFPLDFVEYD
ncbi:MAG: signal peptide peptidase SppA [Rhodothermaceae bacterium]|nr:signal peptide peptidase SppA [Rhodothermaceae bacterium]